MKLLSGEIRHVNGIDFQLELEHSVVLSDIETILDIGCYVILSNNNHHHFFDCYIGCPNIERLEHLISFFNGLPPVNDTQFDRELFNHYTIALRDVKQMGIINMLDISQ